jgi:hypothetical protein
MFLAILIHDKTFGSVDERFVDLLSEKNGLLIYFQIQDTGSFHTMLLKV